MKRKAAVRHDSQKLMQKRRLRRPPPEHAYRMKEAGEKCPRLGGCPNCGLQDRLGELDLIPGAALGRFNMNGLWEFNGETKVFWDAQRQEHDPARFLCLSCDTVFDLSGRIY
jgi:hypothetical protein